MVATAAPLLAGAAAAAALAGVAAAATLAPPRGVACRPPGGAVPAVSLGSQAEPAAPGSVSLGWAPLLAADIYDVEYGTPDRDPANPFGWRTTANATTTIGGLRHGGRYWFKVRAHVDGIGGYGNDSLWSNFSVPVQCVAAAAARPAAAEAAEVTQVVTRPPAARFQRIYRITETLGLHGAFRPPDFLRDHNSADSLGSASFLTFAVLQGLMSTTDNVSAATITEYCGRALQPFTPLPPALTDRLLAANRRRDGRPAVGSLYVVRAWWKVYMAKRPSLPGSRQRDVLLREGRRPAHSQA